MVYLFKVNAWWWDDTPSGMEKEMYVLADGAEDAIDCVKKEVPSNAKFIHVSSIGRCDQVTDAALLEELREQREDQA